MEAKLDVTFRLDVSGMLHVTATDRATEQRQKIVIRNYVEAATEGALPDVEIGARTSGMIGEGPAERSRSRNSEED
jgi:molecular chaperone DnaK (HSP70)